MAGESPRARSEKAASVRLPLHRLNSAGSSSSSSDRFIPERGSMDLDMARLVLNDTTNTYDKENSATPDSPGTLAYKKHLSASMFSESKSTSQGNEINKPRILAFQSKPPSATQAAFVETLYSHRVSAPQKSSRTHRYIPQGPERTLDAPELVDDYYLNLLDWGTNNVLCIALGNTVYKWDASTSLISELMTADESQGPVTSVSWAPDGRHIAVGLNDSVVQIWDSESNRQLRALRGHTARVGSLAWNSSILTSGGLDSKIVNHDVRIREPIVDTYVGHEQEVCGLKWSTSGQQLASGGNDNLLHIWDRRMSSNAQAQQQYLHRLDGHRGAVKAIAWCPFQSNLVASGGGTSDRCIKLWNTHTGACLNSIDTGSQVCALLWNKHERELLSSHGYSQNQLTLWKYPAMVKIAELTGHTSRVLHLAQSPDGYTVASAAGDETLRFWQAFGTADALKRTKSGSSKDESGGFNKYLTHIR